MKSTILILFSLTFLSFSFLFEDSNYDIITAPSLKFDLSKISHIPVTSDDSLKSRKDIVPTGITDVSNMFNERGFYKSNGFSFDEQEIINDFNGNLIFGKPLYNFALAGDLNLNVSINYNGSVGHQFFLGDLNSYESNPSRYSLNVPEWIISVNGIAVQVLNFETSFFTTSTSPLRQVTGDSIRLLIPGYHFDGQLSEINISRPDKILILAGDGSIITLVNKSTFNDYIGAYSYDGKDLHYKAQVSYIEDGFSGYRRRKLELIKGDGAIFEFTEYKRNYVGFPADAISNTRRKPMMFLLEKVSDQFGHYINLSYDTLIPNSQVQYGRPLVRSITANGYSKYPINLEFLFGSSVQSQTFRIVNSSEVNGDYNFYFKSPVTFENINQYSLYNHKAYINNIRNPINQNDSFYYENYYRTFSNLPYPQPSNITNISVIDTLSRIIKYNNSLKYNAQYSYMGPISKYIQVTYTPSNRILKSNYYSGYGRDMFYTNMLLSKTDYDNSTPISYKNFDYFYFDSTGNSAEIDTSDFYESTTYTENRNPLTVNSSEPAFTQKRTYKIFPIESEFNNYLEEPDVHGTVKLMSDYSYYPIIPITVFDQNQYDYERGNYVGDIFTGSFLMLSKLNYMDNLPRLWTYNYTYKDGQYDSVLTSMTETDPLLNKNKTVYENFYRTGLIHKSMSNYLSEVNNPALNDTSIYYKIQLPKSEERLNQNSQAISRTDYEYILNENDSYGYYGQLRNTKQINNYSPNEFILSEFEYYKNDFSGNAVYTGDFYPYKEGNIKVARNPNGEVTKFFYTPITPNEVNQPGEMPELLFYLKYNNGVTVQTSEDIWDGRFPIRTDSYKEQGGTTDTLSITYKSYAIDGSPSKIISQYKYTSNINYEPVHRVSSIILPGDFTPDSSTYTIKYNHNNVDNYIYILSYRRTDLNEYSKVKYSIDGFGNVKEKDVFTSATDSNSFKFSFNYMNKPSDNTDAMNNTTRFSNDGLGRNIQTNYPDAGVTGNTYTYQNNLPNYFGQVYSGFVEFQKYTDEDNHNFEKYFDAVGNLLKEVKFAEEDPGKAAATVRMETDYYYDSLYRLIKVKTPESKYIFYSYDGYGRQSQRITPDAGQTNYIYDKNNNLIYSQDANQRNLDPDLHTFRVYDGVNRITGVGDALVRADLINVNDAIQYQSNSPINYLTVNVYDTLSSSVVPDLFIPPEDYYNSNVNNFTKGNLVSTAYRTRNTDTWSYKYYRYDERGRVIRMWNIISGLEDKSIEYIYNSQDQVTHVRYGDQSEYKRFSYYYDFAGRLGTLNYGNFIPVIEEPAADINFTNYTYNPNSLIDFQFFNSSQLQNQYSYNSRNWITGMNNIEGQFGYLNTYFKNGNLQTQLLFGTYKDYMQNKYNLHYNFSYDNSNRLLNAINTNSGDLSYSVLNTYDKDGNLTTLKRYGDNNTLTDDFNYVYTSGTNKLIRVSGSLDQFNSDLNGNTIIDDLNSNYSIKYDHRNLITELYHNAVEGRAYVYATRYYYDESGNRVRKLVYLNSQTDPPPITDWNNPGNGWQLLNNEFYVKGADGKDLATYQGNVLDEWFVWGIDLTGKIKGDKRYFYYKDHLGSIRAVADNTGTIVAAYDYDAWGYPLENRNYNGDSIKFKYTGKELDKESFYDYFGARYYDARIANWGTVDPLMGKHFDFSPYNYVLRNPLYYVDPLGMQVQATLSQTAIDFVLKHQFVIPLIPSIVAQGGATLIIGGAIVLITPSKLGTLDVKPSIFVPSKSGEFEYTEPISEIQINSDPNVYSKGGRKQVWPDQYIGNKPKNIKDIDWNKGDQELADEITGDESPHGPKSPNNEIKKWFRDHRPKKILPIIGPQRENNDDDR